MAKIKNPEQYIGRIAWSRRQGRVEVMAYVEGRLFRVKNLSNNIEFIGGLGTTYQLLKQPVAD